MNRIDSKLALFSVVLLSLTQGVWGNNSEIRDDGLRAELDALRARIAELETDQDEKWLNEARAQEVRALVEEVLADAETRASLLEGGMTAGHNGDHFFLSSDDGSFLLEIGGQIQVRYVYNSRDRTDPDGDGGGMSSVDDEDESGFELRRTKLHFSGHIASPRLQYKVQLSVKGDNHVSADKIIIAYKLMDNLKIWGGEFKAPFLREETTGSKYQLTVERSLVNEVFTLGYVQGVGAKWYVSDMAKLQASIHDGALSGENGKRPITQLERLQDSISDDDTKPFYLDRSEFAITIRGDLRFAGTWDQKQDFSAWAGEEFAAFLGMAVHWEQGETGDTSFNNDFLSWTIDGSVEVSGVNVYAAVMGLHTDIDNTVLGVEDVDLFGFVLQGGFMLIPDKFEPFIRFEYLDLDNLQISTAGGLDPTVAILTFGANYYLNKHDAKFSLDLVWVLDTLPSIGGGNSFLSGFGLLGDDGGQDDQIALRAQFQLLF